MNHPRPSLLKIDVTLEIRKLTQNRFKSSTEWAVSLCRHLISRGPSCLDISISNGRLVLRPVGTVIEEESLRRLSTIFNTAKSLEERHQAIVEMEDSESFELLCAFYLKNATVRIRSGAATLQVTRSKHAILTFSQGDIDPHEQPDVTQIEVHSGKVNVHSLATVIVSACRHVLLPVYLNEKQISEGLRLPDCFAQQTFEADGVTGVVGIPMKSDFVRQIMLRHGVVVKDSLKQPAFGLLYHAITDSNREVDELKHLRSVVRNLYLKLGARVETLDSVQKKRAVEVLFGRFLETRDRAYIVGVRAFETVAGKRLSLEAVHQLASRGPLNAISPDAEEKWLFCGRVVLVLDAKQWNFLEKDLNITITTPPVRGARRPVTVSMVSEASVSSDASGPFPANIRRAADHIIRNIH